MHINATQPLFAWDALEDCPSLGTIKRFLAGIPDARLLEGLRSQRHKGRNDYPVEVLWGVVLLTIVLRHVNFEACLAELRRNDDLRVLIGLPRDDDAKVPNIWNVSRFLDVLGQDPHRTNLRAVFDDIVQRLGLVVPDLGTHSAGDASALNARRHGRRGADTDSGKAETSKADKVEYDAHGLPQPAGGRKEYTDDDGQVTKVVEWFGYKFHLLVDVKHEVTLAYQISSTKMGDNQLLPALVTQAQANLPKGRMKTLAYDKACDDEKVHDLLHAAGIRPVIQNRMQWKTEPERLLPGHDGTSNIVHDEAGTVYCYDKISNPPVRHPMAYIGHEPERGTLKYRCPAKHGGWNCPMASICNAGKSYGKTVRIKQSENLRRFPPIPRATKQFERLYKGRTAVERVNARAKIYWGADDGNVVGATRFHAFLGAVLVVHVGLATVLASLPRREGTLGRMNLSPIAKALQQQTVNS
jgi:hypothetical protein